MKIQAKQTFNFSSPFEITDLNNFNEKIAENVKIKKKIYELCIRIFKITELSEKESIKNFELPIISNFPKSRKNIERVELLLMSGEMHIITYYYKNKEKPLFFSEFATLDRFFKIYIFCICLREFSKF